jgi:hypothetical protein
MHPRVLRQPGESGAKGWWLSATDPRARKPASRWVSGRGGISGAMSYERRRTTMSSIAGELAGGALSRPDRLAA